MKSIRCRICEKEKLEVILDYGEVALADGFLNSYEEVENEEKHSLRLCICKNCKHLQIDEIIPPELLFTNYVYETGVSKSIIEFSEELYEKVIRCYRSLTNSADKMPGVLEIGSNDGTILSVFKDRGSNILGVDPADNIVDVANKKGIRTIAGFFDLENAQTILNDYGKWEISIARNVLAHVSQLHSFVKGIKLLLENNGFVVIEVPHLKTMFAELQYDQVFHEHIGYHSLDSIQKLFGKYEMEVFDVEEIWIHGGSIRVYLQYEGGPRPINNSVQELLDDERSIGLLDESSWHNFVEKVQLHKSQLSEELKRLKASNKKIAIYGASGKGQSLIQFCEIANTMIEYVVDKSKLKHGKITPGSHMKIFPPEHIYDDLPDVILICAWNFADEIVKQEERFVSMGGKFLHPLPTPHYL